MEKGWLLKTWTIYLENTEWCGQSAERERELKRKEQWDMITGILDRTPLHEVIIKSNAKASNEERNVFFLLTPPFLT